MTAQLIPTAGSDAGRCYGWADSDISGYDPSTQVVLRTLQEHGVCTTRWLGVDGCRAVGQQSNGGQVWTNGPQTRLNTIPDRVLRRLMCWGWQPIPPSDGRSGRRQCDGLFIQPDYGSAPPPLFQNSEKRPQHDHADQQAHRNGKQAQPGEFPDPVCSPR